VLCPSDGLARRHGRLRETIARLGLDAFIVSRLPNVHYLTNLAASAAAAVVTPTQLYLITDFRYSAAVDRLLSSPAAPPATSFVRVETSYDEAVVGVLAGLGVARVGFEAAHVTYRQHATWAARLHDAEPSLDLVPTDDAVEALRAVKDPFETGILREAAVRLSEVARGVVDDLAVAGRGERDLAAEIDARLVRAGFERPAFETIVASGPNAALPHARPTSRRVEAGDLLLFDFGGVFHGYCVDLTRTVAVGPVREEQRRLYRAVYDAQRAAIAAVAPGTATDIVDAAARDLLTARGLGEAFGHSTGHGLGLEVHEDPRVARRRAGGPEPAVLAAGMVCTIEPGAYVPGSGGVRLEDDVLVSETGADVLTDVPFDERLLA
jgi:Xaa-Pro aminopeptidase